MSPQKCEVQVRVERELDALSHELDNRKAKQRPLPRSVLMAYHALMEKHHRRLASLKNS